MLWEDPHSGICKQERPSHLHVCAVSFMSPPLLYGREEEGGGGGVGEGHAGLGANPVGVFFASFLHPISQV